MKLTQQQLRQIIKEELESVLESPMMSGAMNPEDPEVMADLDRRKKMTDNDVWMENNRDFIDFAKGLIDDGYERERVENILLSDRNPPGADDVSRIYDIAIAELTPKDM